MPLVTNAKFLKFATPSKRLGGLTLLKTHELSRAYVLQSYYPAVFYAMNAVDSSRLLKQPVLSNFGLTDLPKPNKKWFSEKPVCVFFYKNYNYS